MSVAALVVYRDPARCGVDAAQCQRISAHLQPESVTYASPRIEVGDGVVSLVIDPGKTGLARAASVCLGKMFEVSETWDRVGAESPDGNYALFRVDDEAIELLTDPMGSRIIWYTIDDERLIASSSTRADLPAREFPARYQ